MIKLKSNQLSYKLFLALCILGSGIHVHAVESSTGTSTENTKSNLGEKLINAARYGNEGVVQEILSLGIQVTPDDVRQALAWAARNGKLDIVKRLTDRENQVRSSSDDIMDAVRAALEGAPEDYRYYQGPLMQNRVKEYAEIMRYLLNQDLEPIVVMNRLNELVRSTAFYSQHNHAGMGNLKDKNTTMFHLFDQYILPDNVVMRCVEEGKKIEEGKKKGRDLDLLIYALDRFVSDGKGVSREMAERLVPQNAYDAATPMIKLRDQGATGLSALPGGVFRAVIESALPRNDTDIQDERTRRAVYQALYSER